MDGSASTVIPSEISFRCAQEQIILNRWIMYLALGFNYIYVFFDDIVFIIKTVGKTKLTIPVLNFNIATFVADLSI